MCWQLATNSEGFDIRLFNRDSTVDVTVYVCISLFALSFISTTNNFVELAMRTDRSVCVAYRRRNHLLWRSEFVLLSLDCRVP